LQWPIVANASADHRGQVRTDAVRETVRRLIGLLEESERRDFLEHAAAEASEPIRAVADEMYRRDNIMQYWDERGGVEIAASVELDLLIDRYQACLEFELRPWLAEIHPIIDADTWIGAQRDGAEGVVDPLLLADAIGLNAYNWNLEIGRSPFGQPDVVTAADPAMVVLSEVYSQTVGMGMGMVGA